VFKVQPPSARDSVLSDGFLAAAASESVYSEHFAAAADVESKVACMLDGEFVQFEHLNRAEFEARFQSMQTEPSTLVVLFCFVLFCFCFCFLFC
jgi:hypothetical protein